MFSRILNKLVLVIVSVMIVVVVVLGYLIWSNNREVSGPSYGEVSKSLEQSVQWLISNRDMILNHNNSMLWWMLQESSERTGDQRILELVDEYKDRWIDPNPRSPWSCLFNENCAPYVSMEYINSIPDYNLHFIYGLTCYAEIGQMPLVQEMNKEDFCRKRHLISPACVTHQLMAVRFMQERNCNDPEMVNSLATSLQDKIAQQLTIDPRVVDVYIQRVLMLVESGAGDRIKNIWKQRVLAAQLEDGGWGANQPLLPLGSGRYFCFTPHGLGMQRIRSTFHATAQGVFLMTLLLEEGER